MMSLKKLMLAEIAVILFSCLCAPSISFALLCPTNFKQFDLGSNMDDVIKQCGKPDSQKESKKENNNVPQEWSYFIPQTVATNTANQAQGTLKTTVNFDKEGNAINISVNGIGVGASTICGKSIQLGDQRDAVQTACGKPASISKQLPPGETAPADIKITEFIYNTNPPLHMIFENGKLTETK